ncbi:hypothetical protein A6046_00905 [[Haemophilus] ducreyi]|uniref:Uncharacterized protein n=1 Tax=Haemophilus ducreyi TaxID=730 RepID=A0AAC8ZAI2_HAEDC|nr:hypothetical protein [[Haemophilus] ducreyi]AKO30870.1 hypothetical protein RY60_03805 [[Haemophilus] ducreyi]AKO32308.1 hypothetical protein RZ57_03810 [[Haemophilus] ducreyi]AKO33762.1 hypothetical protein RZ58_03825 [[Haemophilus] ducreyi]AKO35210.1 hypothetical protein RZ59_03790 [[Haemophilus] ducreyi]AKO36642.1 hypothetical protein RZ61_03830 [[Haemophilus] ducreyi]
MTNKIESSKLPLTYALSFASHLISTETFLELSLRDERVKALFDYAELIQEEYEKRIKNQ